LKIYRKYYGGRMSFFLLATLYVAMAAAGLIVGVVEASIQLNYPTALNVVILALAAVLVWRFLKTGGPEMLKEM
jgi:hypothetical protein